MNLKGFKKIKEDNEKAILQNQRGHQITLAKKQLSKSHNDALSKLPLYAAEGADIEKPEVEKQLDNQYEQQAADDAFRAQLQDQGKIKDELTQSRVPAMSQEEPTTPAAPAQPAVSAKPSQPVSEPVEEPVQTAEQTAAAHAQEAGNETAARWSDIMQGHITPETYKSLYEKKDTLGKIGTLFGLLVSGAGSGLSHQPNMVLDMMNKELEREFEAQKRAMEGSQNLYHLNQQNEMNKANIKARGAETLNTLADAQLKADTHTKNDLIIHALKEMQDITNKVPPGPQRAQMEQTLNSVNQAGVAEIAQNNQKLGQMLVTNPEGEFQKKQKNLRMMGMLGMQGTSEMARANDERHVPGVGDASIPIPDNVRQELISHQKLDDAASDLLQYSKSHTNILPNTPEYNKGKIKSEVLQQMIREGMLGTVFRESEKPLLKKFVDENPAGVFKMLATQPKLREILESSQMQANAIKKQYGLPMKESRSSEPERSTEEKTLYTKSGKPYVIKDGKAIYK